MPEPGVCLICKDLSLGKNYGVVSCFGCKAFFQRTIRRNIVYTCTVDQKCSVEKTKRNKCRYCRFQKCLQVGMRKDAVQEERDKLLFAYERKGFVQSTSFLQEQQVLSTPNRVRVEKLIEAELLAHQHSKCAPGAIFDVSHFPGPDGNFNAIHTKLEAKKLDILFSLEWAKYVPCFRDLDVGDQLALLKAHAAELILLDQVKRSITAPDNIIVLANGFPLHRDAEDTSNVRILIINEVLKPLKQIQISNLEVICMKALALLNPSGVQLVEPDRVRDMRFQVQLMLEDYIREQPFNEARGRLSQMLLSLHPLSTARQDMKQMFNLAIIAGIPLDDHFVREVCLHELFDMGRAFIEHPGGVCYYSCYNCDTPLTNRSSLKSTRFTAGGGTAYLFDEVLNITYSESTQRRMITGLYFVRDVFCKKCNRKLGWYYEMAKEQSEAYKENYFVIERALITECQGIEGDDRVLVPPGRGRNMVGVGLGQDVQQQGVGQGEAGGQRGQ